MKKVIQFLFVAIIFATSSCGITYEYHFNKDLSGNYRVEMKIGDMLNMLQAMDTTGNFMSSLDTLDKTFAEIEKTYEEAGAKNISAGWKDDKTTIFIKFDFSDTDNLNAILENASKSKGTEIFGGMDAKPAKFSHKGKRNISFDFSELDESTISSEELSGMKDYMTVEAIFSFDRKIKKFDNKNAVLSADGKSIKFSGKLDDIMSEDFTYDTNVKLKFK